MTMTVTTSPMMTRILLGLCLGTHISLLVILVKDGDDHSGCTASFPDLEEGVVVTKGLLTLGAVVEVLTDGTLVAMAHDWVHSTAITSDVAVNDLWLF